MSTIAAKREYHDGKPVETYSVVQDDDPYIHISSEFAPRDTEVGQLVTVGQYRLHVLDYDIMMDRYICAIGSVHIWQYRWLRFAGGLHWKFKAWWKFTMHLWHWQYHPFAEESLRAMWREEPRK